MAILKDIENMMKTPEMKKQLKINARIKRYLKKKFGSSLTNKEYDKVMWTIPDYNPKNESEAKRIGVGIILKYRSTGKIGGAI